MTDLGDLASAAAFFGGVAIREERNSREALERASKIVQAETQRVIGTYDYGWPKLKPETVARKKNGDTPLLETGELKASIERNNDAHEAYVGSNNPKAVWHELGTSRIPPRSSLGGAARHKEPAVVRILGEGAIKGLLKGPGGLMGG